MTLTGLRWPGFVLFLVFGWISRAGAVEDLSGLQCLVQAYPGLVDIAEDQRSLQFLDGSLMAYDLGRSVLSDKEKLENADLNTQLSGHYALGVLVQAPARTSDPGRFRVQEFFERIYGLSQDQVRKNLEEVWWAPCACYVPFSKINGASQALKRVGEQLALEPALTRYVSRSLGSFNWRTVSRSTRLSMHAFGIAIDFALPDGLARYWQWSGCQAGQDCPYPQVLLTDQVFQRVVQVFESNGFIWGGKWFHYDSVHFEYRPEFTIPACQKP